MTGTGVEEHSGPPLQETDLLVRLRAGDERAFEALVERHHPVMLAVARSYVKTHAAAEEVVQDAWLSRASARRAAIWLKENGFS